MPRNESADQLKWSKSGAVPSGVLEETAGEPFWKTKGLAEMSAGEWEALCDGCGRCCLIKLEDDDTGNIAVTRLACKLLDLGTCRCSDYDNRQSRVPDCVKLTPEAASSVAWLPKTCAYRLVAEGRDLLWWHPLVSGTSDTVHAAGISVRGAALPETKVRQDRYLNHIVEWIDAKKRP